MYVAYGDPDEIGSGSGASGFDCSDGGYFKFADNTVNVAYHVITKSSPFTGNRYAAECIMVMRGKLLECPDGDSLENQIDALVEAVSYSGRTWALYNDDGSATSCALPAGVTSLVDGPRVTRYSFPRGDRAELATNGHRTFFIEARALYDYPEPCDLISGIIEYHERFQYVGLGGQQWASWYDQSNALRVWTGASLTPTRLIQSGYSRGWGGYVLPLAPATLTYTHWDQCVEEYGGPTAGSAKSKEYTMRWRYPMTLPSQYAVYPTLPYYPLTKV